MLIFVEKIMPELGLHTPTRGYSPPGTRDKLDFICKDSQDRSVVVEIKKDGGEKRVVQQVLNYIRLVRNDPEHKDPRGIIITGYADFSHRHALEELEPGYHIDWFIYGLIGESIKVDQIEVGRLGCRRNSLCWISELLKEPQELREDFEYMRTTLTARPDQTIIIVRLVNSRTFGCHPHNLAILVSDRLAD